MKSWLFRGVLASAIALPVLSGTAWAGGGEDFGCSNAVLKGEYAFGVTTYSPVPGVVAGIKVFDGNGNLTQRDYIGDSVPAEFAPPGTQLAIEILGERKQATVVRESPYDPDNLDLRA